MISATDITVQYGPKTVLSGLNFTAEPGQLTAIVGSNGSGKSTLLKAIAGALPIRGQVKIQGHDMRATPAWKLASLRAVLPQASPMAFPFQVIEVVRLGLNQSASAKSHVIHRALSQVGLSGYAHRLYQELSGGEQQRVQLARVLCQVWDPVVDGVPRWLMLDEPVSSLDVGHQLGVMKLARAYARAGGGVVAVMHDLNLTAMFADAVALMHDGKVVAQGTTGQVLTDQALSDAYGCQLRVGHVPQGTDWFLLPHSSMAG